MSNDRKYRILVVDDEASVLLTYRLILEQQGYSVAACGTAREAIQTVREEEFDLVLCDYSLEEQHTGFEVIEAARQRTPGIPAALLTGYATKETADEAAGQSIGIMFKPIEIDEFLATTFTLLRRDNEPSKESGQENTGSPQGGVQGGQADRGPRRRPAGGSGKA